MKKIIYNLDFLVSVEIHDKEPCNTLVYKPFKKSFWGNTEEGFYYRGYGRTRCYTKTELESGVYYDTLLLVENNVAYQKPYVILNFVSGIRKIIRFKTYEEALKSGNGIADSSIKNKM